MVTPLFRILFRVKDPFYWSASASRKLVLGKFFFWKPGSDIENSFSRLIQNRCFFFLIDGLDEFQETYEERYKDLVRFLSSWVKAAAEDMKLSVSSREYYVFVEHFKGPRSFELQELTYNGIYNFIRNKLEHNQNFFELESLQMVPRD